jgi:hypothetical protein
MKWYVRIVEGRNERGLSFGDTTTMVEYVKKFLWPEFLLVEGTEFTHFTHDGKIVIRKLG